MRARIAAHQHHHHLDTLPAPSFAAHAIPLSSAPSTPGTSLPSTADPSPTHHAVHALPDSLGYFRAKRPPLPRTRTGAGTNASPGMRRALEGIRAFVASKSCYDILPESFRSVSLSS